MNRQAASLGRLLRQQASLLGLLLLGFVLLFGWTAWRSERADQIQQLQTALQLSAKALDRYFMEVETGLRELSLDLLAEGETIDLARAQRLMQRYYGLHPEGGSANLARMDGQILASSRTEKLGQLPNLSNEPSFREFQAALRPDTRMLLGRPLFGPVSEKWVFPVRYVVRNAAGAPLAVIASSVPVDLLASFWRDAPIFEKAAIGLIRDDGYLLSRYPVPPGRALQDLYSGPRLGALTRHLADKGFPNQGYVEGINNLAGTDNGNVFRRLDHFPVTLFISMPVQQYLVAWLQRVGVPFVLVALLGGAGMLGYRYTLLRETAWNAERRQTEAALRASEEEQRFLVDHLLAGVVVHDADGLVLRSNPQACALFGLSLDQMLGKAVIDPTWRFVREDGSPMPVEEYPVPMVMKSRAAQRSITLGVMQPGLSEPVWLQGDAYPAFDDAQRIRRVIVTFVDISMRHRIEKTLARSESRYRMLYENSLDGVLQTRPDGTILSANPAACRLFGMSEDELRALGRNGVTDMSDARVERLLAQREREGQARGEIRMKRRDGTGFEAEVSSVLYADTAGQPVSSMVVRDVTDRRRAEAALAAKELAERANRAKSDFMARMSHELRTPLNAILGFTEVLALDTGHPLQPVQHERLRHIQQAGDHLLLLIDDLLDLSRIESGSIRLEMQGLDAAELTRSVLIEVAEQARECGVELVLELPPVPLRPVHCDRTRMRQVLLNLVSNGIKYNADGGRVTVALGGPGERFELSVRDTGLGMTAAQTDKLFQPFNRLGREGSDVEGTGIGLVITRSLVELMGGQIAVTSQPGQGTAFHVSLPWAQDGEPASTGTPPGDLPVTPARGKVLYIDDDPVNRVLMQAFLSLRPGVQLSLASDGTSGLALAEQLRPDLLLVDMMMPTMNGVQVLQALRASTTLRATPCLAVSANAMPEEIAEALAAGFDGYLTKPLSAPVLLRELDRMLA